MRLCDDHILTFFKRQSIIPFETVFGFFCMYSGVAGILAWGVANDLFRQVLGELLANIFNVTYLLAGLGLYFGIGLNRRDIEACGLIIIMMSLVVRSIAIFFAAGFSPDIFNNYIFTLAFIVACVVRLVSLIRRQVLIEGTDVKLGAATVEMK